MVMEGSRELAEKVASLFDGKRGARSIAKELGVTRHRVLCIYRELGIDNSNIKGAKKEIPKRKVCKTCNVEKDINEFRKRNRGKYICYEPYCKPCEREIALKGNKIRYKEEGIHKFHDMYSDPKQKEEWLSKNKEYRDNNKEKLREYRKERRHKDRENRTRWGNKKRKEDPAFKIRGLISGRIRHALKSRGKSKNGSISKYLPYTMIELKEHLENQFEDWMSWENHGVYDADNWDDGNPSTWTWQIDHIKPHSEFKYSSMEDDEFLECWKLDNLRPLSAKQNIVEGACRIRHKIV